MSIDQTDPIAGRLVRPEPVSGRVVEVDCGYAGAIVLTVKAEGSRYYETYELAAVEGEGELTAGRDAGE